MLGYFFEILLDGVSGVIKVLLAKAEDQVANEQQLNENVDVVKSL